MSKYGDPTVYSDISGSAVGTETVQVRQASSGANKTITLNGIKTFIAVSAGITVNRQTGTAYTLLATDNGCAVEMNNAAANVVSIPAGLPAGFNCIITQIGAGQTSVAIVGGSGVTLRNPNLTAKVRAQYRSLTLRRTNTPDELILDGFTADT